MPELLRAPTRELRSPTVDSRRWDRFEPRDGDIIIGTFAKCGTTWTQRIVDLLVHQSPDVRPFGDMSPWLDATFFNALEDDLATLQAQTHRRYIKSHLPFDALPVWEGVKYIHVGRDGRDAQLSWHNHMQGTTPAVRARIGAEAMRFVQETGATPSGPPPMADDPRDHFVLWLDELEAAMDAPPPAPPFFDFEATYWRERARPNLLLVHYNDLKEDLTGEMRRISDFLEIDTPAPVLAELAEAASFGSMKAQGNELFPKLKEAFDRGADRFINQGRSGRWREILLDEDVERYEAIVQRTTTPALPAWLETGRRGAGDPRASPD